MLSFKQFLIEESIASQVYKTQKRAEAIGKDLVKTGKSIDYVLGGIDTFAFIEPSDSKKYGGYNFFPKGKELQTGYIPSGDMHVIKMYTDNPEKITDLSSQQNSTLRHELQHVNQRGKQRAANPSYAENLTPSTKYNNIQPTKEYADSKNYLKSIVAPDFSYTLDSQEVNARGIQRAGDAIRQQNDLSRSAITSHPLNSEFRDYEFNLEKSKGMATAPKLDPNIGRKQAEHAFSTQMGKENNVLDDLSKYLEFMKQSDATKASKDIKGAKKSIASDIARGLQSNVDYAQSVAADSYSDKVIGPQRERQQRVANTQAEVEGIKTKYGGFQTSPFLSDPLSTANMAADMAGALGDVHSKAQTMTKAQSSLYNPMFSDSEQMMGDAFLRGGGEEYQVDPRFLQVQKQREKDRQK